MQRLLLLFIFTKLTFLSVDIFYQGAPTEVTQITTPAPSYLSDQRHANALAPLTEIRFQKEKENECTERGVALCADNLAGANSQTRIKRTLHEIMGREAQSRHTVIGSGGWNQKGEKLISSQLMAGRRRQRRTFTGATKTGVSPWSCNICASLGLLSEAAKPLL